MGRASPKKTQAYWVEFKRAAVLILIGPLVTSARADPGADDALKVEFIEVKGHECLQPVVSGAGAQLADYRAAEVRWLASKYPGVPTPEATTEIVVSTYSDAGDEKERTTVHRETFFLDGIVGEGAKVCFDINLKIDSAKPHE
jgi:hypothetical protein